MNNRLIRDYLVQFFEIFRFLYTSPFPLSYYRLTRRMISSLYSSLTPQVQSGDNATNVSDNTLLLRANKDDATQPASLSRPIPDV